MIYNLFGFDYVFELETFRQLLYVFILGLLVNIIFSFFLNQYWLKSVNSLFVSGGLVLSVYIITKVVSTNIALSLGLVGALSIVRFRSAIKDPLDIIFMFWSITVGIANGIGMVKISLVSTIFISLVCFILYRIPKTMEPHVLVIKFNNANLDDIFAVVKNNSLNNKVISNTSNLDSGELVYKLRPKNSDNLLKEIKSVDGVNEATLLMY